MAKSKNAQATKQNFFRIHVRPDLKPTPVVIGTVKDNQIVGDSFEAHMNPPDQWIPNYYEAKVVKKITNGRYNGEFIFWNDKMDESPEIIEIRYLKNCTSLDKRWQEANGYEAKTEEEEIGFPYESGKVIDIPMSQITTNFIRFMEHHELNGDNPNRDVNHRPAFIIINSETNLIKKESKINNEIERLRYIEKIKESDDFVNSLSIIHSINFDYDISDKRDALLDMALIQSEYEKMEKTDSDYISKISQQLKMLFDTKTIAIKNDKIFDEKNHKHIFVEYIVEEGNNANVPSDLVSKAVYESSAMHVELINFLNSK